MQRDDPREAPAAVASWLAEVLEPGCELQVDADGIVRDVADQGYARSFGDEWTWFSRTQLDAASGGDESERTFFAKTGLTPAELDGSLVLDAGCGMGRFADVARRHGARVVAVDLSEAVRAARRNLPEDAVVMQADVRRLPFRPASFDIVYSLGVLHHTPDTRAAFDAIARLVRPGGTLAVWVYSGEPAARRAHRVSDVLRHVTTRLPHRTLLRLSRAAAPLGGLYRTRLGSRLYPLLPVSAHERREWRALDTFDWYSPKYQWKHRWAEVESWFGEAGFVEVRRLADEIAVTGRRPACP